MGVGVGGWVGGALRVSTNGRWRAGPCACTDAHAGAARMPSQVTGIRALLTCHNGEDVVLPPRAGPEHDVAGQDVRRKAPQHDRAQRREPSRVFREPLLAGGARHRGPRPLAPRPLPPTPPLSHARDRSMARPAPWLSPRAARRVAPRRRAGASAAAPSTPLAHARVRVRASPSARLQFGSHQSRVSGSETRAHPRGWI